MSEHQARLQILFDTMTEGVVLFSTDGQITEVNPAAERILGLSRSEIIERKYTALDWRILRPDGTPMPTEEMAGPRAMQEKRAIKDVVMGVERPDGSVAWIRAYASPILNDRGGVDGIVASFADVTVSKRAEDRHRAILKGALDGFWINDMEGRLLEVNDSYCRMVGCTREELLTMSIPDIEDVEKPEETARHLKKVAEQGYDRFETRHRCKDGTVIDVEISANYLDVEGGQMFVFIRDVTERKLAEEALEYSERNYRMLVESIPQKVFLKDINSLYISCNDKYAEDLNIEPEDIAGHTDYDFYPGELAEKYIADDRRVIESGKTERFEETYTVQGQERVAETYKTPVKDRDGNTIGLLGIFHDITERRQAEAAREEAERHYRLLADNVADVVSIFDLNMNLLWVSPSIERQTGYTPEEMKKVPPLETMTPESVAKVIEAFSRGKQLHDQGKEFIDQLELEAEVYRKDGSTFWADVRYRVIRDSQGRPSHVLMQGRDITEHRKADEALRESKELYDQLAEQSRTIAWEVDAAGLYTYISPVVEEITGYRPDEIVGKMHFYDLHPDEGREAFKAAAFDVFKRKGSFVNLDNTLVARDGRVAWVTTNGAPLIGADGALRGYRGSDTDITERKQAEESLRESEEENRAIVEVMPDIIFRLGSDGQYIDIKSSTETKLAAPKEELLKKSIKDVLPSEASALVIDAIRRTIATNEVEIVEYVLDVPAGKRTFEARISRINRDEVLAFVRDITERKQAEAALRASEERFRNLADMLPQSVFEADESGTITFVNREGYYIFGFSREDVASGVNVLQIVTPKDRARAMENINLRRAGEELPPHEYMAMRKDGSTFPAVVYAHSIIEGGRYAGVRGILIDITERKQAEDALRQSEERYRFITDNTSDSIWALGPDLRMIYQSPSTERLFGYTLGEWHKIGWDDYVHPDHLDAVTDLLNSFRRGQREGDATISVRVRDKHGKELWAEISASPVRGPNGEFAGVVGITRDITERKEAEERLIEYRIAVEQSADGIALSDLAGNIRFVNEAWARMHGYSVGELIGRHLSVFHTREQMESQVSPFNQRLRQTGSQEGDVWHVRRNGEVFATWMTTTLLKRADGEPFGMFAFARDITEQKEMERQQRDREIAEARADELSKSRRRLIDAQESLRKRHRQSASRDGAEPSHTAGAQAGRARGRTGI
jgi:PAS domain S-box-containing protein